MVNIPGQTQTRKKGEYSFCQVVGMFFGSKSALFVLCLAAVQYRNINVLSWGIAPLWSHVSKHNTAAVSTYAAQMSATPPGRTWCIVKSTQMATNIERCRNVLHYTRYPQNNDLFTSISGGAVNGDVHEVRWTYMQTSLWIFMESHLKIVQTQILTR